MDKFASRIPEELSTAFAKMKQTTMNSKEAEKGKSLDISKMIL